MRPRELFLFYLTDYANDNSFFYVDANGLVQTSGQPIALQNAPDGWLEIQLSFGRSQEFYGINRSFSVPLKFVEDGAQIIREKFYKGAGIEQLIQLVVLKWDSDSDVYKLYSKQLLDLVSMEDTVAEGVTVSLLEGGALQMLKTYKDTVFEIPCDGSIPENVLVYLDGIEVQDVFNYQFVPHVQLALHGNIVMPALFLGNQGDNFGIIHNNPTLEQEGGASYFSTSQNYVFSSSKPTTVNISGTISLHSFFGDTAQPFQLLLVTSLSSPAVFDHSISLVPNDGMINTPHPYPNSYPIHEIFLQGSQTYTFSASIPLGANESLFIVGLNLDQNHPITLIGGEFTLTFNSSIKAGYVWGIRANDLYRLLITQINQLSTTSETQSFLFNPVSKLLDDNKNLILTSGDAIRASGDPNYNKFYNPAQTTLQNPTYKFFDFIPSVGPVLKTCLTDLFASFNVMLNASLSNQKATIPGQPEQLFLEDKEYVFDSSSVTLDLTQFGDVAKFKVKAATDYFFNLLRIGYLLETYDEKQGKYEYNTTAQWSTPIKTTTKIFELISKYRTDSYGIEYTRANLTKDAKSSTYNGSDASVFVLNVDEANITSASQIGSYIPAFAFPTTGNNASDNLKFASWINEQGLTLPQLDGAEFLSFSYNNPSVFVFNASGSIPGSIVFSYSGNLNGLFPGDTARIDIYVNNTVVDSQTYTVNSAVVNFSHSFTQSQSYSKGDCVFMKVTTSNYCTCNITQGSINVGSGWFIATITGAQTINPGTNGQLIVLSTQTGTYTDSHVNPNPVTQNFTYGMSYGFPMYVFNADLNNKNFLLNYFINFLTTGADSIIVKLYYIPNTPSGNSVLINQQSIAVSGSNTQTLLNVPIGVLPDFQFSLGDIFFFTISVGQHVVAEITSHGAVSGQVAASFTLTSQNSAYKLLRKQYDSITGIPTLSGYVPGGLLTPITTGAGGPFNIEQLTPGRLLKRWGNWIRACLYSVSNNGNLTFQTLDKNRFLTTSLGNETIVEGPGTTPGTGLLAISSLDAPLFYPFEFSFETQVPLNFADLMTGSANGHIKFSYNGINFYGFPLTVTSKPALNESQKWTLLCSPLTNINDLVNLNYDGLNSIFSS